MALATVPRDDFVQTYERELPAVVQCFTDDFDACIAHLRFPLRHRRVVRTTNLLERLFLEERIALCFFHIAPCNKGTTR